MLKYGIENFEFEIIYQSKDIEHALKIMEPYFIKLFDTYNNGYNRTLGGDGTLGRIVSQETKEKLRILKTGTKHSKDTKLKMSKSRTGLKRSEETKLKMSLAQSGINGSGYGKRGTLNKNSKSYKITKQNGETISFTGLAEFARNNGYSVGMLSELAYNKRSSYKDVISCELIPDF